MADYSARSLTTLIFTLGLFIRVFLDFLSGEMDYPYFSGICGYFRLPFNSLFRRIFDEYFDEGWASGLCG